MELKVIRNLIIITFIGALYVAVQSVIWTIQAGFPLSVVIYVICVMLIVLIFVGYVAKNIWKDVKENKKEE